MKISSKGNSKYLSKEDVSNPITATMNDVHIERLKSNRGEEDKYILSFAGGVLKPMVLNVLNRKILISLYGDESDLWRGQLVEIYVDPTVSMGGDIVGGIRLRKPSVIAPKVQPSAARVTTPQKPPTVETPTYTPHQAHEIILKGFAAARTTAKVDEFTKWGTLFEFTPEQDDQQSDAFHAALARISPQRAAMAGANHDDSSIPF